jgi:hypothetical protein
MYSASMELPSGCDGMSVRRGIDRPSAPSIEPLENRSASGCRDRRFSVNAALDSPLTIN